jgi:hypothetical protein
VSEFHGFWTSLAVTVGGLVLWAALATWLDGQPWRFEFHGTNSLLLVTPWGGVHMAHEGFDPREYAWWTGIKIYRRLPGTWHLRKDHPLFGRSLIYTIAFQHEMPLRRRYL